MEWFFRCQNHLILKENNGDKFRGKDQEISNQ